MAKIMTWDWKNIIENCDCLDTEDSGCYVYGIKYEGKIMYVGKSKHMLARLGQHLNECGTDHSAIPEGTDLTKISFIELEHVETNQIALAFEDAYILKYDTINNGWNKQRSGAKLNYYHVRAHMHTRAY